MSKKLFTIKLENITSDEVTISITGFGEFVMTIGDTVDIQQKVK